MKLGLLASPESWYYRDLQRAAGSRFALRSLSFTQLAAGLSERPWVASGPAGSLETLDAVLVRTMPPGSLEQIVFRMDALHRLAATGTPVFNPPRCLEFAVDKYLASALLQAAQLPTPHTIVCQTVDAAITAFHSLGQDVVLKPLFGSEGRGITRLTDEATAWRTFQALVQIGAVLYLQQFIPHPGSDLRLLLLGDEVLAIRRRNALDWRTNVSRGATAEPVQALPSQVDLARRAALAVGASMVGVDILTGCDGQDYVLEVNAVPGWKAVAGCHQIDVARMVLDWLAQQIDSHSTKVKSSESDATSAEATPVRSSE